MVDEKGQPSVSETLHLQTCLLRPKRAGSEIAATCYRWSNKSHSSYQQAKDPALRFLPCRLPNCPVSSIFFRSHTNMTASAPPAPVSDSMYSPVYHKNREGSISLTIEKLVFRSSQASSGMGNLVEITWSTVIKHQVSPANYPKPLLKVVIPGKNHTFQMINRQELERVRKDITNRLRSNRTNLERDAALQTTDSTPLRKTFAGGIPSKFDHLDPNALAVSRSTILASNPALRQQHQQLVIETKTLSEEDFWATHSGLLEEEYARISGITKPGMSSVMQSYLPTSGKVILAVEEMRQIFILYPAVHKAYEEKVPLEMSDEQFWRKYLESEFFHRDRGRIGSASSNRNNAGVGKTEKEAPALSSEQQEARAAAIGTDDIFSRYDQKLREQHTDSNERKRKRWGQKLAVGQFDLASTYMSDRGTILEGPRDYFPSNPNDDEKGTRVINKYNRHWAMVLHPEQAVAGSNLIEVSRQSSRDTESTRIFVLDTDSEMRGLLKSLVPDEDDELTLQNVEAYYTGQMKPANVHAQSKNDEEEKKRHVLLAQAVSQKISDRKSSLLSSKGNPNLTFESCFPPPELAKQLLVALTQKMAKDSRTESQSLKKFESFPVEFREQLQQYFRRTSELLRHFYSLRKLGSAAEAKLNRIVEAMEKVYRDIDTTRKALPQEESGMIMSKMSLSIMSQLDWAFKVHREREGGGGFVSVT